MGAWRAQSATCTAQSERPSSANSRVPSSGSMIHTRSAFSRDTASLLTSAAQASREPSSSSESTASAGRHFASSVRIRSCETLSPADFNAPGSAKPSSARRSSSA